jgi:hypothetical protein
VDVVAKKSSPCCKSNFGVKPVASHFHDIVDLYGEAYAVIVCNDKCTSVFCYNYCKCVIVTKTELHFYHCRLFMNHS